MTTKRATHTARRTARTRADAHRRLRAWSGEEVASLAAAFRAGGARQPVTTPAEALAVMLADGYEPVTEEEAYDLAQANAQPVRFETAGYCSDGCFNSVHMDYADQAIRRSQEES